MPSAQPFSNERSEDNAMPATAQVERINGYYTKVTFPHQQLKQQRTGLRFARRFTRPGVDPLDEVQYERRSCSIKNPDGSLVFAMVDAEVPKEWTQVASDVLISKYFRKAGVPQYDERGEIQKDEHGEVVLGPERSVKQVVKRLAGCWRYWGARHGYFASEEDGQIFEDELKYMLVRQMAAPNSPQWFNTGLNWAYGITGPSQGHYYIDPETVELRRSEDSYTRPQPHACFIQSVNDDLVNEGGIMDLWVREARLFKYGSGTGTNFSNVRGAGEPLSGGGTSSGLMSWLKIGDRAAGAIKSGGTTRRAAKMVCLDIDHPDIEAFINWKLNEEKKVAVLIQAGYASDFNGEAYGTVSGQNSNNSVRIPHTFMRALHQDDDWQLTWRTDPSHTSKTLKAQALWQQISYAAWACADPGVQFDDTINEWHTCLRDGKIRASNPCSEYMFLDNTACNLASINLLKFYDVATRELDVESYKHAIRLWTVVLEISVLMAQFPSKEIAELSYMYRTLGLGYANIGTMLMMMGLPYDSEEGRAIVASVTAILTGESYATSAEMARELGSFPAFERNREDMLRVMRNHRRASYNSPQEEYEDVDIIPFGIHQEHCPTYLLTSSQEVWDKAVAWGEEYGYRNAQTTCIAPTGTIGLVMDCDTTGIEPDFALIKFKKLAGGGYWKIANHSVEGALEALGYARSEIEEMMQYLLGTMTLQGTPFINSVSLKEKGLTDEDIEKVETQLKGVFELSFAFNKFVFGEEVMRKIGIDVVAASDPSFDMLRVLGFSLDQITQANRVICGHMTLEGAPHLKPEHLPVFDCANTCGDGSRFIPPIAHVTMIASAQPFISGSISKTVNLPKDATVQDIDAIYYKAWEWGVKAIALYRDGSKLSQPLNSKSDTKDTKDSVVPQNALSSQASVQPVKVPTSSAMFGKVPQTSYAQPATHTPVATLQLPLELSRGQKRRLPKKRNGLTIEARVASHKVYVRTGEYEDGTLGEIFIDMHKEGAAFRSMMNCFAISISHALQYGVPLEKLVETFIFTRFEPQGITDHPNIKTATSVIDFIFRVLAMEYLGRTDFVHIKPEDVGGTIRRDELAQQHTFYSSLQNNTDNGPAIQLDVIDHPVGGEAGQYPASPDTSLVMQSYVNNALISGDMSGVNKYMSEMMGDAPACDQCGHITVRNGACYKCLNCGNSLGCS